MLKRGLDKLGLESGVVEFLLENDKALVLRSHAPSSASSF